MKRMLCLLILCVSFSATYAQDVYYSSGTKNGYKHKKAQKGYDPSRVVIGGALNLGYSGDYANVGIAPTIGYKLTERFSAGVGVGYQFYKEPNIDVYNVLGQTTYIKENIVYPSIWAKYQVWNNIFIDGDFEYDFINVSGEQIKYDAGGNPFTANAKFNTTVPCLLFGVGLRQPIGGRTAVFIEVLYDVLQQEYSPYYKLPVYRGGISVGL